jgi:predicted nucleotidyltransferase
MAKIPKKPEEVFGELRSDYADLFGDDLISIALYGSGARGEYVPKTSDLNFLIILTEKGIERLGDAIGVTAKWEKRNTPVPLFLTKDYIESSLDAFPLEFFNIRSAYKVIYGDDIIGDLEINKDNLRLQCERELKGKLLLLRESFLQAHGDARLLRELIRRSLPACISIFKALLFLNEERLQGKNEPLIQAIAEKFGLDKAILQTLWQIKTGEQKPAKAEIKEIVLSYISTIRILSKQVDQMSY